LAGNLFSLQRLQVRVALSSFANISGRSRFDVLSLRNTAGGRCSRNGIICGFSPGVKSPVARATYPRFTLVRSRVIRRGDLLHAAFRYPLIEPRTTGPVLLHLQTGNAHGICFTLRSFPSPAGPGV